MIHFTAKKCHKSLFSFMWRQVKRLAKSRADKNRKTKTTHSTGSVRRQISKPSFDGRGYDCFLLTAEASTATGRSAYMQIRRFPHVGLSDLHNFNIFKKKKFDIETGYSIALQLLHPNWWGCSQSSPSTPDIILSGHPRL